LKKSFGKYLKGMMDYMNIGEMNDAKASARMEN